MFEELFYRPFFNTLIFFYQYLSFGDLGVAIILFTIFIRLLLLPVFYKSAKDQTLLQRLAPEIKKIQEAHGKNYEARGRALMNLYKEHRVNPLSGFLMMIFQVAIMIALYRVFLRGFSPETLSSLYDFLPRPANLSHTFLNLVDLNEKNIFLVLATALAQYFQGKLSLTNTPTADSSPGAMIAKQMVYLGPLLTIFIFYLFPAAITLHWLTTTMFSVIQQMIINSRIRANYEQP
ncbi:membrane protein insertase YidC [Candidatus Wolfebacteria bacterium]|nr:membrane protein insertase YidC [Candidatus Wolfebacteria bacterium]